MRKILKVAEREYVETVKTKMFLFSILMTPILIGTIAFISHRASRTAKGPQPEKQVAITDLSGELSAEIQAQFDRYNTAHPRRQLRVRQIGVEEGNFDTIAREQKDRVRSRKLLAYVVLDKDVIDRGTIRFYTQNPKPGDLDVLSRVENMLYRAVVDLRCERRNVSRQLLAELRRYVRVERVDLGSAAHEERVSRQSDIVAGLMVPFFFMFLMFMGIFGMGQHMLTSIIEEKSSRIIEVLLSAISPFELMAGKILGLAGISLTVLGLWGAGAYAAARWGGVNITVPGGVFSFFLVYYLLGFVLLSSILAGIGAVCNTAKEAQSLMLPVTLILVIPMVTWFNLAQNPNGTLARALSYIPPVTPMVMILRLGAEPNLSLLEVAATIVLLVVSVPVVMWMAAKVFRTGVLMYGKRPSLREIFRWVRQN